MTLYDYWTKIHIACSVGVFLGRVNVKKLEAIQPAMFTEDKGSDEGRGRRKALTPLIQICFSPLLAVVIKIRDDGHNFR